MGFAASRAGRQVIGGNPMTTLHAHRTAHIAEQILADSTPSQIQSSDKPLRCENCGGPGKHAVSEWNGREWVSAGKFVLWKDSVRTRGKWLCQNCIYIGEGTR